MEQLMFFAAGVFVGTVIIAIGITLNLLKGTRIVILSRGLSEEQSAKLHSVVDKIHNEDDDVR